MASTVLALKDIRDEVLSWLDEAGATGVTRTNVDAGINQAHSARLTKELWNFMIWDSAETFNLVVNQRDYAVHPEFHRPLYFYNRDRKLYLRELPLRIVAPSGARWNEDRDPTQYVLWGRTHVAAQPSSASTVSIVSSSGSDSGSTKNITVRGVAGGAVTTDTITPTGITPVAGTKSFTKILGVTKAAAWAGTLTVTSNGGVVTNLTLNNDEFGRSYQQLYMLGLPSTADVIEYRFYRLPRPLTADFDVPDIPPTFSRILVWDSLLLFLSYDNRADPARLAEFRKWQEELDVAMRVTHLEQQTLEAEPQYVRSTEEEGLFGPSYWLP